MVSWSLYPAHSNRLEEAILGFGWGSLLMANVSNM
jgi:hypothetical protein